MTRSTKQALLDNEYAQAIAVRNKQYQFLFELMVDRVMLEHRAQREQLKGVHDEY